MKNIVIHDIMASNILSIAEMLKKAHKDMVDLPIETHPRTHVLLRIALAVDPIVSHPSIYFVEHSRKETTA